MNDSVSFSQSPLRPTLVFTYGQICGLVKSDRRSNNRLDNEVNKFWDFPIWVIGCDWEMEMSACLAIVTQQNFIALFVHSTFYSTATIDRLASNKTKAMMRQSFYNYIGGDPISHSLSK